MSRRTHRAALLLCSLAGIASADVGDSGADRWLAIPDLEPAEIDRLAEQFELRGSYGDLTLAIGDDDTEDALTRLHPRTIRAGDYRRDERVFAIQLAPGEPLRLGEQSRLLLERESLALVGVPGDSPRSIASVLSERRGGHFHDGIARVSDRRQRPQRAAPQIASIRDPDERIQRWVDSVSAANLQTDVIDLSTLFSTRRSDTVGAAMAQQWLIERFEALGLSVSTHSFDDGADNIIVDFPGAIEPERVVIVGAHYDSVNFSGGVAPGADDNASGTAALLEIARILAAESPSFRHTLRLIAFASEEFGLVGSSAYSKQLRDRDVDVIAMLNTDMNAYRLAEDARDLDMVTSNTTAWLTDDLIAIANLYVPNLPTLKGPLSGGTSDHASFFNDGFPAAFYFEDTGNFSPFIHTARDTIGRSANDFELSRGIVRSILAGASVLAEPIRLALEGACPGSARLTLRDMTPNAPIFVFHSASEGTSEVRGGACRGAALDLAQPRVLGVVHADADGHAELVRPLPDVRCGERLQAMDLDTCSTTNVIRVPHATGDPF